MKDYLITYTNRENKIKTVCCLSGSFERCVEAVNGYYDVVEILSIVSEDYAPATISEEDRVLLVDSRVREG